VQNINNIFLQNNDGTIMNKSLVQLHAKLFYALFVSVIALPLNQVHAFELLSEGAMGTVSAVSANSAEEIVNVAGATAAGLRVDDYESLPFQVGVSIEESEVDEVSTELNYALTQEVENWAENMRKQGENSATEVQVGYVDELPPSSFDDAVFFIRDNEFDSIIFDPDLDGDSERREDSTAYELGRIEQTFEVIEQNVGSIHYIVERHVEFAATIDAHSRDDTPSMGSGYITDLRSIANVKIATVRD